MSPETKEEYLLFGYNKALENIFEVYRYQSLSESFIKDLHYFLYESLTPEFGGKYKKPYLCIKIKDYGRGYNSF